MSACYFASHGVAVTTPVRPHHKAFYWQLSIRITHNFNSPSHTQKNRAPSSIFLPRAFSLSLPHSLSSTKARASRAISCQYCVRPYPAPAAPACIQWQTFFFVSSFLNEKWRGERFWLCGCRSLHPLLVAWEGPKLWAGRPQPSKTRYTVLLIDGCQAANTGP